MAQADTVDVYLEVGRKRVFACAVDWPGWSRSGRDESSSLTALLEHAPRYARVAELAGLTLPTPRSESGFAVVERIEGDASTDFGAPTAIPPSDLRSVDGSDLERLKRLLQASWQTFDAVVAAAAGKELRKGPRGGGRSVEGIVEHVLGAERGYLSRLGRNPRLGAEGDQWQVAARVREEVLDALDAAGRGELPERGPRGGTIWPARYYVRRAAWHVLDHAWEIEDKRE